MSVVDFHRRLSLRVQLSLVVALGVGVLVVVLAAVVAAERAADSGSDAAAARSARAADIARDLDARIELRRDALVLEGAALQPSLGQADALASGAFFRTHPLLMSLFDDVLLVDRDGTVLQDAALTPGRAGHAAIDGSDAASDAARAAFRQAVDSGRAGVLPARGGTGAQPPAVAIAAPIVDAAGRTTGVLVGMLHLDPTGFLARLHHDAGAARADLAVVAAGDPPVFIAHRDPGAVLKPAIDAVPVLQALRSAPWSVHLAAPQTAQSAGPPLLDASVLFPGLVGALLAGVLVWLSAARLLAPLSGLRVALQHDADGAETPAEPIDGHSADIAALVAAYQTQKQRRLDTEALSAGQVRLLRDITDNLPALVAFVDSTQTYRFNNAHYRTLFGLDPQAMVGRTIEQVLGRRAHADLRPEIEGALGGQTRQFERCGLGPRRDQHLLVTYVPRREDDGSVAGFYVLTLDITQRKQAELDLAESERRLKSITDNLPALVAFVDRSQTYRLANAQCLPMLGLEPGLLVGQTMKQILGDQAHDELKPMIDAALRGERCQFERTRSVAGSKKHDLVDYVPDIAADGSIGGFFVTVLDITERRRAEQALAQSEKRMRDIADNLPAMISHVDHDMRYTFANAEVGRVYGCRPESLIGRTVQEVRGDAVFNDVAPRMARALAGEPVACETTSVVGGRQQDFEARYVPEFDRSGRVVGLYALAQEVTQRREAERALRASRQLLDRTGRMAQVGGWQLELATGQLTWTEQTRRIHEVGADYVPTVERAIGFYAAAGRPLIEQAVADAWQHGTPWDLELPFTTARGRSIWVRATGEVDFEGGKPARVFGAFQDVSPRAAQDRELRERLDALALTLASIGDAVLTTDGFGRVHGLNPAAERLTGWAARDAAGLPSADVLKTVDAATQTPLADAAVRCLAEAGRAALQDGTVLVSRLGERFAVDGAAWPIMGDDGRVCGAVAVFRPADAATGSAERGAANGGAPVAGSAGATSTTAAATSTTVRRMAADAEPVLG